MKRLMLAVLPIGLAFAALGAAPALTQRSPFDIAQNIETAFADVETLRLRGDCAGRDRRLRDLATFLTPVIGPNSTAFRPEVRLEYGERLAEAARRRCPPGPEPRPAPLPPPPAAELPRTVSLDALRERFRRACGEGFDPARSLLLIGLNRAISQSQDPRARAALDRERSQVIAAQYRECDPVPPPPPAEPPQPPKAIAEIERMLVRAETMRQRGECSQRSSLLIDIGLRILDGIQSGRPQPFFPLQARYEEESARACPPPRQPSPPPAPPTPRAPTGRAPNAPLGQTPAPARVAICPSMYRSHTPAGQVLTCRCQGPNRNLMTWGSGPYSDNSAICNAGIHAGALPRTGIGTVRLTPVTPPATLTGSMRNGIATSNWHRAPDGAFRIEGIAGTSADEVSAFPPDADGRWMTGTFDTSYGPMLLTGGRGTYTDSGGRISPTRIQGSVLEAVWEQNSSSRKCADGRYRGRLRFVFSEGGFTGTWGYCDDPLNGGWNGTRREAPQR